MVAHMTHIGAVSCYSSSCPSAYPASPCCASALAWDLDSGSWVAWPNIPVVVVARCSSPKRRLECWTLVRHRPGRLPRPATWQRGGRPRRPCWDYDCSVLLPSCTGCWTPSQTVSCRPRWLSLPDQPNRRGRREVRPEARGYQHGPGAFPIAIYPSRDRCRTCAEC